MSEKAKELAANLIKLVSDFEQHSPSLSGKLESIDSDTVDWNLHLDDEEVKIVVDIGSTAFYIDQLQLVNMLKASEFFNDFEPSQRELIMSILEREVKWEE